MDEQRENPLAQWGVFVLAIGLFCVALYYGTIAGGGVRGAYPGAVLSTVPAIGAWLIARSRMPNRTRANLVFAGVLAVTAVVNVARASARMNTVIEAGSLELERFEAKCQRWAKHHTLEEARALCECVGENLAVGAKVSEVEAMNAPNPPPELQARSGGAVKACVTKLRKAFEAGSVE